MKFKFNQSYIGFSILVPCLLYLLLRNKLIANDNYVNDVNELNCMRIFLVSLCLFFIILVTSIYILELKSEVYNRPMIYFIAISIACVIIANQIFFFSNEKKNYMTYLILLEIFLLALNIRWSIYYLFPGISGIDSWYHIGFIQEIISLGHFNDTKIYTAYSAIPSMHMLVVLFKLITEINLKDSYFILSIIEIVSTIFVFLIAKNIFSLKSALLSVLILNMSDQFINWSVKITPMTLGAVYFTIVIYLIYSSTEQIKNKMIISTICLMFLALTIFTHTIANFVTLVTMFSLLLIIKFLHPIISENKETALSRIYLTTNLVLDYSVSTIGHWMYLHQTEGNSSYLSRVTSSANNAITSADIGKVEIVTQIAKANEWLVAVNHIGYSLLIISYIISFILLIRKRYIYGLILSFIPAVLFCWIYVPALVGSNATLPHRWFLFLYVILSVFAPLGVFSLFNTFKCSKFQKILLLSLIFFIFSFSMVTNSMTNEDSPVYQSEKTDNFSYARPCYFESEVAAGNYVKYHYDGIIVPDRLYVNIFRYWYGINQIEILSSLNPEGNDIGFILLRKSVVNGCISESSTSYMFTYLKPSKEFLESFKSKKYISVYTNGEVFGYLPTNLIKR